MDDNRTADYLFAAMCVIVLTYFAFGCWLIINY